MSFQSGISSLSALGSRQAPERVCPPETRDIVIKSELDEVKKLKNKLWINCAVLSTNEMRMTAAPEFTYNMCLKNVNLHLSQEGWIGGVNEGCPRILSVSVTYVGRSEMNKI